MRLLGQNNINGQSTYDTNFAARLELKPLT
jgi:hypothetical protein